MFRRPATAKAPRGARKSRTETMAAPLRGWNARDGIASMKLGDAVILDNFFPDSDGTRLRKGSLSFTTGLPDEVESFLPYNKAGAKALFAASGTAFYNVTSSGAVGASVVSGLTNARWESVNFTTSGGIFLLAVNGTDSMRRYDGTTWLTITNSGTGAVTGITTSDISNIAVAHQRVWFVKKDSLSAYYLATNSIAGAATEFPLGGVFAGGGHLVAIGSWSVDSGSGMDDLTVFYSSEGEVAIYRGIDPSSSATWSKQGLYKVGIPVGKRCMAKFASDLILLTREGLFPLSKAIATAEVNKKTALTDRIQSAVRDAISLYGDNFGWEICLYDTQGMLLLNVPINNSGAAHQYVMNTITGAWCRFLNWSAFTFTLFNGDLYFGANTKTKQAWIGGNDDGALIQGDCLPAFSLLGSAGNKHVKEVQPVFGITGPCGYKLELRTDFNKEGLSGSPSLSPGSFSLWDTAEWDTATWGGSETIRKDWETVFAFGRYVSPLIRAASKDGELKFYSINFILEDANIFS